MKKFTLIATLVFVLGFTLSSCKKDYTCTCTITEDLFGTSSSASDVIENSSKDDAKNTCNQGDGSETDDLTGITITSECEID